MWGVFLVSVAFPPQRDWFAVGQRFLKKTSVGDRTRQLGTIELVNVVWNVSCAFGRVERVPSNVYTAGRVSP